MNNNTLPLVGIYDTYEADKSALLNELLTLLKNGK